MAVSSEIKVSKLENFRDCSAEFYRPYFLKLASVLRMHQTLKLRNVAYITDGEHGSPQWDSTSGIHYITAEFIGPNFIRDGELRLISRAQDNRNSRARIKDNDVLIYSVGAYAGLAAKAEPHLFPANIPRSVAIVRLLRNSGLLPGYLSVFLNSKYGIFQSQRFRAGNSQPVLALEKIKQFEIPIIPTEKQIEIETLYQCAYENRLHSRVLYNQAQKLLEHELGLDKLQFDIPVGYEACFSEVISSVRLDSEHFFPAFDQVLSSLPANISFSPLSKHLLYCQRGKQPKYSRRGLPVINSKHVQTNKVILEGNRTAQPIPDNTMHIQYEDVLINGTGRGTIGRTAPYLESYNSIPDNHVTILRSTSLDPVYLSVFLNSLAGQLQVEKHQRGSSGQLELYPFDIRRFLIWDAPDTLQEEIRAQYDKAISAERESQQLLQQAKRRVEDLIEEAMVK